MVHVYRNITGFNKYFELLQKTVTIGKICILILLFIKPDND